MGHKATSDDGHEVLICFAVAPLLTVSSCRVGLQRHPSKFGVLAHIPLTAVITGMLQQVCNTKACTLPPSFLPSLIAMLLTAVYGSQFQGILGLFVLLCGRMLACWLRGFTCSDSAG